LDKSVIEAHNRSQDIYVGSAAVFFLGLGATSALMVNDQRNLAAGTMIGTAVIALVLLGIAFFEEPCVDGYYITTCYSSTPP